MSASEELKELHPLLTGPPARKIRDDVWDQIVAVVEAAERLESECADEEGFTESTRNATYNALLALEEALGGGDE